VAAEAVLQSDFRKIGIKLDIQNYPPGEFFNLMFWLGPTSPPSGAVAGRFDIAEFTQNVLNYDPDDATLLACDEIPPRGNGYNFGSYCNPTLDALYRQEQATVDPGVRQQIFVQIHQIYLTEFPFIVFFNPVEIALVHKETHNYQPGPFISAETVNIWEWWCDHGKC
jgi:peptide/nickel transport system substrate-binding protein